MKDNNGGHLLGGKVVGAGIADWKIGEIGEKPQPDREIGATRVIGLHRVDAKAAEPGRSVASLEPAASATIDRAKDAGIERAEGGIGSHSLGNVGLDRGAPGPDSGMTV